MRDRRQNPSLPARCVLLLSLAGALVAAPGASAQDNEPSFRRGDSNGDARWDISDTIYTLSFLFLGGPAPPCDDAADTNDDGVVDMSDAIWLLQFLFQGAEAPPPPARFCGVDPTADDIGCASPVACPEVNFTGFVLGIIASTSDTTDPVQINDLAFSFDESPAAFEELCIEP